MENTRSCIGSFIKTSWNEKVGNADVCSYAIHSASSAPTITTKRNINLMRKIKNKLKNTTEITLLQIRCDKEYYQNIKIAFNKHLAILEHYST